MNQLERQQEAYRLTQFTGREVEFRRVDCPCDYWQFCVRCGGSSYYFTPVYIFCGHPLLDDDRNELCRENDCAEREQAKRSEVLPVVGAQLRSLREIQSERDEVEAA